MGGGGGVLVRTYGTVEDRSTGGWCKVVHVVVSIWGKLDVLEVSSENGGSLSSRLHLYSLASSFATNKSNKRT